MSPCGDILRPTKHTKDAKFSEPEINNFLTSGHEALVFHSWVMAEVHQQTQLAAGASRRRSFLLPTKHTKRREILRAGDRQFQLDLKALMIDRLENPQPLSPQTAKQAPMIA